MGFFKKFGDGIILIIFLVILFFIIGFYGVIRSSSTPKLNTEPLEIPVAFLKKKDDYSVIEEICLARDRERSRLQEKLDEMLRSAGEEEAGKIGEELLTLLRRASMEKEVENLLKAKGFQYNTVIIYPEIITVIIKGGALNPNLVSDLGGLITEITGYPPEKVRIIE